MQYQTSMRVCSSSVLLARGFHFTSGTVTSRESVIVPLSDLLQLDSINILTVAWWAVTCRKAKDSYSRRLCCQPKQNITARLCAREVTKRRPAPLTSSKCFKPCGSLGEGVPTAERVFSDLRTIDRGDVSRIPTLRRIL